MIKHLSSFSPTFLLQACLILVTICPLLHIHTLKKVTRSFAHAPGAPDYQFHVAGRCRLPSNAPLPSSASLNFRVTTGRRIKHRIQYHKLRKTHAHGVQVDQGERTACKVCIPAAKLVIVFLISI
ncbi:hypothetical protein B0H14DRAFT_2957135, partial [Mycena olivaceomarginata]